MNKEKCSTKQHVADAPVAPIHEIARIRSTKSNNWVSGILFWGILNLGNAQATERQIVDESSLGSSPVWSWMELNKDKSLRAIGMTIEADFLLDLPEERFELEFKVPQKSSTRPYRHITLGWEPHGHEPDGIYNVPHFDLHFYMIPAQARKNITCAGADANKCLKAPDAGAVPPDYVPTPAGVPEMGWHWLDSKSPEFQGQPFTKTMIQGYYNGKWIFIEPMVTAAFLQTQPDFTAPIRQPSVYPQKGYYPTEYRIHYRAVEDEYDIYLTKMVYRK